MPTIYQRTGQALDGDPDCISVDRVNYLGAHHIALYVGRTLAVMTVQLHRRDTVIEQILEDGQAARWMAAGGEFQVWAWGRLDEGNPQGTWQVEVTPIMLPGDWLEKWAKERGYDMPESHDRT